MLRYVILQKRLPQLLAKGGVRIYIDIIVNVK